MTKSEFRAYAFLPQERERTIRRIERLQRQMDNVPTVKTKVQASSKEYPYIETHVTVDAPEPVRYSTLKKDLYRARRRLAYIERKFDRLDGMIGRIEDSRTRQILTERYVEGAKLKDVAIKFDLTEQGVLKIINKTIKLF